LKSIRYAFLAVSFAGMLVLFHGNETNSPIIFWSGIGIIAASNMVRLLVLRKKRRRN
jgi:hypothetical protein